MLLHLPPFTSIVSWKKESLEREKKMCQKFLTNTLLRCETLQQSRSDKQDKTYVIHPTVQLCLAREHLFYNLFIL